MSSPHYKSWSDLRIFLEGMLCDGLRERITYFLTRYHDVHAYGRAAIRLDGKEIAAFTWMDEYRQMRGRADAYRTAKEQGLPTPSYAEIDAQLRPVWDASCILSETDFLRAALRYRELPIRDALASDDCLIRVFAILDRRVGTRTLRSIRDDGTWRNNPPWVRQFYALRLGLSAE